jgi:hypothetical protein
MSEVIPFFGPIGPESKAIKAANFVSAAVSAWAEVFPNSRCGSRSILGAVGFNGYLSKDASECASRISENDPLSYYGFYDVDSNVFKEDRAYVFVKPAAGSNNVYGIAKLRCASIKEPNRAKLVKRFLVLREFLRFNEKNFKDLHFNIEEKIWR